MATYLYKTLLTCLFLLAVVTAPAFAAGPASAVEGSAVKNSPPQLANSQDETAAEIIPTVISPQLSRMSLDDKLWLLEDKKARLHLEDFAQEADAMPWQSYLQSERLLRDGGVYWFQIALHNPTEQDLRMVLQTEFPLVSVVDLFALNEQDSVITFYEDSGLESSFSNRPILHQDLINTLTVPAGETIRLLWRVDSEPLLMFRATLWDSLYFTETSHKQQLLYGLIYGALLIMVLYNLFLYFSTWQTSYGYLAMYILTSIYLLASQEGHLYQHIAPNHVWAKLPIHGIVYVFNLLWFGLFTIRFLELRKRHPNWLWVIRLLSLAAIVSLVAVLISSNIALAIISNIVISVLFIGAICAGIQARRAGFVSAGYYVVAIMVLALTMITGQMAGLGLLARTHFIDVLPALGAGLMLLVLSLALSDNINELRRNLKQTHRSLVKAREEHGKTLTERKLNKERQDALEQEYVQTRQESQSKSDFLATLSHEIRTPMHGVLGMAELMKETDLSPQQAHYLNTIEQSGRSLLSIINDLRDFAKFEAGKLELEVSAFNLEMLADTSISTFSQRAAEKGINLIADIDPTIQPVLKGDPSKLQQVIFNLLSNAFKYTEQGDIILSINPTAKPSVNSIELKIAVSDSGIGLTQEEQQRLFTPFRTLDENVYGYSGRGELGLTICKQLVELMDGQIGVSSTPGSGSYFWFTTRLLIEEHPDPALVKATSPQLHEKQVLLIEPNQLNATILCRRLRAWQMQPVHATDLEDGLEKLATQPFDLVISDFQAVGPNLQFCLESLKSKLQTSPSNVLLMATATQLQGQQQWLDDYRVTILEKPLTINQLHEQLLSALSPNSGISNGTGGENSENLRRTETQELVETLNAPETVSVDESTSITAGIRTLVAEDNPTNLMVICGLLKQLGIAPDTATTGAEALGKHRQSPYQLILMDCDMPVMDGYKATELIRQATASDNVPETIILALSAHVNDEHQQRAMEVGMDGYLTKPITLNDLKAAIQQYYVSPSSGQ